MTSIDYIVVFAYLFGMIAIGPIETRKVKGQEDYYTGGCGFGELLQTFAAFGSECFGEGRIRMLSGSQWGSGRFYSFFSL